MLKPMHGGIVTAGVAAPLCRHGAGRRNPYYRPLRPPVHVCVVNVNSAEQSRDGETPLKLQVMKFASDNLDNRRRESLLSSVLSAHASRRDFVSLAVSNPAKSRSASSRATRAKLSTPPLFAASFKPRATASHAQEFCQLSEITG